MAEGDFRLMIYQTTAQQFTIKRSLQCPSLNIQFYLQTAHFTFYKYTLTQNELISSSCWPKEGWVLNLLSSFISYIHRLQINADTIHG